MSASLPIEPAAQALVELLRAACHGRPMEWPDSIDWRALHLQARQQGVDLYLYPWLASQAARLRAASANEHSAATLEEWRAVFLAALVKTAERQRQLSEILAAFAKDGIEVVPLKGARLCEWVYEDPVQRSMSDLDLLIKPEQFEAAHTVMLALGYQADGSLLHNPLVTDMDYRRPGSLLVEMHRHISSAESAPARRVDLTAIWRQTVAGKHHGIDTREFTPADQLAHLAQHMLHHLLAIPLRGYLDLALVLRRCGDDLTIEALEQAAARWRVRRALPFVLSLACELFDMPPPSHLTAWLKPGEPQRRAQALQAIFVLPTAGERAAETTLLDYRAASRLGRLRLMLARVFRPRLFLAQEYPCARTIWGLPVAWLLRARDLRRRHLRRLRAMMAHDRLTEGQLDSAASRRELTSWLEDA